MGWPPQMVRDVDDCIVNNLRMPGCQKSIPIWGIGSSPAGVFAASQLMGRTELVSNKAPLRYLAAFPPSTTIILWHLGRYFSR